MERSEENEASMMETGCQLWHHLSSHLIFFVLFQFASFPHMVMSLYTKVQNNKSVDSRVVIKSGGPGISPSYYECGFRLLLLVNKRKMEPKDIRSRLIPHFLVVFTRQLEILVTTLG